MRDSPLVEVETNESRTSSFRRMLTKYFESSKQNKAVEGDEMDYYKNTKKSNGDTHDSYYPGALLLASSSYYQGNNNLKYSLLAGIFQGLGTTTTTTAVAVNVSSLASPKTLGRIVIPGGLAFETHHALSHALYQGVFQEDKQLLVMKNKARNSPIGYFENVLSYELNIVSGATAGLVYSLAHSAVTLQPRFSKRTTATNMLGFAALFGGYDVYSDIFGSLLLPEQQQDATANTTIPTMAVIGLAGGCAGITQAWVIELRRSILAMRAAAGQLELASETAARYATAATTQTSTSGAINASTMMRAFVPGAAAFLVYERFGNLMASSTST